MTSFPATSPDAPRTRQNWVIDPLSDGLFIIAAPAISLVWAVTFTSWLGPEAVLAIFTVFNIAHHLPTFIRIYGDRDLFQRFRWSLLLGPILPFSLAMCVVGFVVLGGHHLSNLLYLGMILVIWDPWHFLMQHYGFMRIYDRNNRLRREVSSRMDLMICATWFTYIMVATLDWLPDLLYDAHRFHGLPILFLFDDGVYAAVQRVCLVLATGGTLVYAGYLAWCRSHGYFVSPAKLALLIVTFGVMILTYVPNPLITSVVPDWNFSLGFAVLGMVHVTQYLAIVWKYNRGLSQREGATRSRTFRDLFARGGWAIASAFVLVCLLYGFSLSFPTSDGLSSTSPGEGGSMRSRWFIGVVFALGFTSTLLHYYYDGFIWKVRHEENQRYLGILPAGGRAGGRSWWDGASGAGARGVFLRQCLYFVAPMVLLSVTFWALKGDPMARKPIGRAVSASSAEEAQAAIAALEHQLEIERAMIRIRPRARHHTYEADLLYIGGLARLWVASRLDGDDASDTPGEPAIVERRRSLARAISSLERALELGPPYGHGEDPEIEREDLELRLREWRSELRRI